MLIEVSIGEIIDKLTILELKLEKIKDDHKLIEIKKEIKILSNINNIKDKYIFYYNLLKYINDKIWIMTDLIKLINYDNEEFSYISFQIFEFNQKRFRIKHFFNIINESNIKEQKSYNQKNIILCIEDENLINNKIKEINYLFIEYDNIIINIKYKSIIEYNFEWKNIIYINDTENILCKEINLIDFY